MSDGRIRLAGVPGIEVVVKRSTRARRLSLRVSSLDGRVTLTMPNSVRSAEAQAFAEDRQDWIAEAISRVPATIAVGVGMALPVEGRLRQVTPGLRARIDEDSLFVPPDRATSATRGLLRALARDRLVVAADRYAATLGKPYRAITLRDTRSRWGSCTSEGRLMFSWRLIMAPPSILDYVAAHEVAHLAHMDHSKAFWQTVEAMYPNWRVQRDWLRERGGALHRYSFGD